LATLIVQTTSSRCLVVGSVSRAAVALEGAQFALEAADLEAVDGLEGFVDDHDIGETSEHLNGR